MSNIIHPKDVFAQTESLSFWWSVYGWSPSLWEDIYISYKDENGVSQYSATTIDVKGYVKYCVGDSSEYAKDQLDGFCEEFNKSIDELLNAEEMFYGYYYDSPTDKDFYEVGFDAPRNENGVKPRYIVIYHPAEKIDIKVVKEAVSKYCRDFLGIPFCKVHHLRKPKRTYMKKLWGDNLKQIEKARKYAESGGRWKVRLVPEFLEQLFGTEEVFRFEGQIDYGFVRDKHYFVKLKDGTECPIGETKLEIVED